MSARQSLPSALNDRAQDLLLLSKGRYGRVWAGAERLCEAARRIVAFHNVNRVEDMTLPITADVVMDDLWSIIGIQMQSQHTGRDLLLRLGPEKPLPFREEFPACFHGTLVEGLLNVVARARMRSDQGAWLLPIADAEPDPAIKALLACEDPASYTYVRPTADVEE